MDSNNRSTFVPAVIASDASQRRLGLGKALALGALAVVATAALPAFAAADVSGAVAGFTEVGTAVSTIGQVMLGAVAAGIVYKWVTAFII